MNHYTWVYVAGGGRNVPVGLYHSSKKGHLLIYVGKKITTIDFNVLDSKEYTFFIDNELCRIKLERRGDKMFYFFEIDKTTDTPLNRARRAMERKFVRQLLIGLVVFVLVVSGFVIYMNNRHTGNAEQMEKMLARHGVETLGRVLVEKEGPHSAVSYQYIVHNQSYTSRHIALPSSLMVPRGGMPLETGDEFVVTYFPPDPEVSRIDFARPSQRQIQLYRQRAIEKHLSLHPHEDPDVVRCMVGVAYTGKGLAGVADFYFQDRSPFENANHNKNSFYRLMRSVPFQKKVDEECHSK